MNNYNYFNYDWYRNMNNNYSNINTNNNYTNLNLFSPNEGFEKGNLFYNLYNQYKNYKPATLKANNEQERKLYELQAICFAAHELNLYLDIYPENQSMLTLFNDYCAQANKLQKEYESKYGPMTIESESNNNNFAWESSIWPWEVNNV